MLFACGGCFFKIGCHKLMGYTLMSIIGVDGKAIDEQVFAVIAILAVRVIEVVGYIGSIGAAAVDKADDNAVKLGF